MASEFIAAVKRGDRANVDEMLRRDPGLLGARDGSGTSPLLLAYLYGHPLLADAIRARMPALDLHEAAAVGDVARIREAATADRARVDAYAADGFTALGLAALFGRPDAVRVLLELGADPRSGSRPAGLTPLHSAAGDTGGLARTDVARLLLRAGADANARSANGDTPLHAAASTGDVEVARLLIAAGGSAGLRNDEGATPLDVARDRDHFEVAALLHDAVIGKTR